MQITETASMSIDDVLFMDTLGNFKALCDTLRQQERMQWAHAF